MKTQFNTTYLTKKTGHVNVTLLHAQVKQDGDIERITRNVTQYHNETLDGFFNLKPATYAVW